MSLHACYADGVNTKWRCTKRSISKWYDQALFLNAALMSKEKWDASAYGPCSRVLTTEPFYFRYKLFHLFLLANQVPTMPERRKGSLL